MVTPPKTTIFTIEMNTGSTIVQVKYCFTLSNESLYINNYIIYSNTINTRISINSTLVITLEQNDC